MKKAAVYGIIAAAVVASAISIAFAVMVMNVPITTTVNTPADSNEVMVIEHDMGTTEITGKPERILALGPEFTEHLLTLGVQPAGIIDSSTLRLWYPSIDEQLSPDVADLGDYPVNIEAVAELDPDLIIGESGFYGEFYGDLSDIAPTVLFNLFPEEGEQTQLERMEQVHMEIADIVGKHDQGVANIEGMHAKFDEAAGKLEAAGLSGDRFIYLEAGVWEDAPWMYAYAQNAELALILEEMGLENAVPDDMEFDRRGFIDTSLEALAAMDGPDVHMFYTTALGDDVFSDSDYWVENPVWTNLEFVKAGQVYNLDKVYAFAGPSQAELLADKVVEVLVSDNGSRTISHVMGEITITGTPERVVTLYSVFTGDVRALGVQPAGTADRDWINGWLTPLDLAFSEEVVDVGIPDEPNLEVIAQLEPDLIIGHGGVWGIHDEIHDDLSDIAPTMILDDSFSEEGLDELELGKSNFMKIADALNRHDEGVAYLERLDSLYAEAAAKIDQAGMAGTKFVFVQAYLSGDAPGAYVFTENSFSTKVMNNIGLVNDLPDPADTTDKWFETGMEGITTLDKPGTHLIVTYNAGQYEGNPLATSPLWDDLSFVKEGRVHDIGNTRVFGQVIFIEEIVNRVVNSFTSGG